MKGLRYKKAILFCHNVTHFHSHQTLQSLQVINLQIYKKNSIWTKSNPSQESQSLLHSLITHFEARLKNADTIGEEVPTSSISTKPEDPSFANLGDKKSDDSGLGNGGYVGNTEYALEIESFHSSSSTFPYGQTNAKMFDSLINMGSHPETVSKVIQEYGEGNEHKPVEELFTCQKLERSKPAGHTISHYFLDPTIGLWAMKQTITTHQTMP